MVGEFSFDAVSRRVNLVFDLVSFDEWHRGIDAALVLTRPTIWPQKGRCASPGFKWLELFNK